MSFDIYLVASPDGATFDRAIAERAFADIAEGIPEDEWWLRPVNGSRFGASISVDTTPQIEGVSINRPPDLPEFWDALFEILRQTQTFLVWPAPGPEPAYCVAHSDWSSYIGPELTGHMGSPALVTCGADIPRVIDASGA